MLFARWFWGERRYIVNQIYFIVVGMSLVALPDQPVLSLGTIVLTVGVMIWRYRLWRLRNPAERGPSVGDPD